MTKTVHSKKYCEKWATESILVVTIKIQKLIWEKYTGLK